MDPRLSAVEVGDAGEPVEIDDEDAAAASTNQAAISAVLATETWPPCWHPCEFVRSRRKPSATALMQDADSRKPSRASGAGRQQRAALAAAEVRTGINTGLLG